MPREAEPSLSEQAFVSEALKNGLRLDGRALDKFRPLELTLGEEYGLAHVRCGKTRWVIRRRVVFFSSFSLLPPLSFLLEMANAGHGKLC